MDREADSLGLGDKHPPARGSPQRRLYLRFPRPDGFDRAGNHLRIERVFQHEKPAPVEGIRLRPGDAPKRPSYRRPLKPVVIRMTFQAHSNASAFRKTRPESSAQALEFCPSVTSFAPRWPRP